MKKFDQTKVDHCIDEIAASLSSAELSLNELLFVLGNVIISTGVALGAAPVDNSNYQDHLKGPTNNLPNWIRNTGLLFIKEVKDRDKSRGTKLDQGTCSNTQETRSENN